MPIHCPLPISPVSDVEFEEIDKAVMACAYASQNELGRLCDERVYENDVAARLRAWGFAEVHTQVPVTVSHEDFSKIYRLDLVANRVVYELKTVAGWIAGHDSQAIHYAVMLSVDQVKLLNFRPVKVMGRLWRAPLLEGKQRNLRVVSSGWVPLSARCDSLAGRMKQLIEDWGAFLEARLYEEALIHFCGGEDACVARVSVSRDGIPLGSHCVARHADNIAFVVTAITGDPRPYREHLRRLLRLTGLLAFQWLNLSHTELQLVTLQNGKGIT